MAKFGPQQTFDTNQQMKFAQLLVYGVEGSPISKTEAAQTRRICRSGATVRIYV